MQALSLGVTTSVIFLVQNGAFLLIEQFIVFLLISEHNLIVMMVPDTIRKATVLTGVSIK